jgi:hypothetical protein
MNIHIAFRRENRRLTAARCTIALLEAGRGTGGVPRFWEGAGIENPAWHLPYPSLLVVLTEPPDRMRRGGRQSQRTLGE